ncbi:MAG: hypothetical protein CME62_10975 [Halobacteriovoraceae bacterium]|nr:hypothetical protein [Halobacteriovoraceae bacterium]|tara:strand:- start:2466 stop:2804 length:339 start_codon:yes stop_codon:yes gene_type:complete
MVFVAIFLFIAGSLFLGFKVRPLKSKTFEVTSGNKHPDRPMAWYENRIREQIKDLRFEKLKSENGVEYYKPRSLYQVNEPELSLEVTPYVISVTGSRLMIRLISTYVEIEES